MGRRQAREAAVQVLYQIELGDPDLVKAYEFTSEITGVSSEDLEYAKELVDGVKVHRSEIDGMIAGLSREWRLERIAVVDRNIMRLAIYEILFREDIPPGVSINEAVDLAKTFGGPDSGRFVNGILGKVAESKKESPENDERPLL